MDQIDGLEAYEMLQKNEEVKNIPIIFVSGFVEIEEISEVLRQHPDQIKYMKKPVSLNELLKLIRKVLGK
jgi:CheY-like chemotaxis protein